MPARPLQLCRQCGCRTLTRERGGRCEAHRRELEREGNKAGDPDRKATKRFYAGLRWRKLRQWILEMRPLCAECERAGVLRPATEVDHVIPRLEREDLAYDQDNLQGLCRSCHSAKTMKEGGRLQSLERPAK